MHTFIVLMCGTINAYKWKHTAFFKLHHVDINNRKI